MGSVASILEPSSAALSGSIDIIVVRKRDGTFACTPFHVRFGRLQLFRSSEKAVQITVNGQLVDLQMKLGQSGEAFFVQNVEVRWLVSSNEYSHLSRRKKIYLLSSLPLPFFRRCLLVTVHRRGLPLLLFPLHP